MDVALVNGAQNAALLSEVQLNDAKESAQKNKGPRPQPIGDLGAVVGFFSQPAAALKTGATISALGAAIGEFADGYQGFNATTLGKYIKPFSNAGAMTALPAMGLNLYKASVAVIDGNIEKASWSFLKTVNSTAEFCQGLWGSMGEAASSKVAGTLKHFTAIPADLKGMWDTHNDSANLRASPDAAAGGALHEARLAKFDAAMVKNATAFLYHAISFAISFFAFVVSPFWGLVLGCVSLVAAVVNTVFTVRVTDLEAEMAWLHS